MPASASLADSGFCDILTFLFVELPEQLLLLAFQFTRETVWCDRPRTVTSPQGTAHHFFLSFLPFLSSPLHSSNRADILQGTAVRAISGWVSLLHGWSQSLGRALVRSRPRSPQSLNSTRQDLAQFQLDGTRYTTPPFITKLTRLSTLISLVGSPGTAITSAK